MRLGGPVPHQVGVGDQHPGRVGMRLEDAHRLAGLHEQGLVIFQFAQGPDDGVEGFPGSGCFAAPPVDDQLVRQLGYVGIEIVHQHTQGCLLQPALTAQFGSTWRTNGSSHRITSCENGSSDYGRNAKLLAAAVYDEELDHRR